MFLPKLFSLTIPQEQVLAVGRGFDWLHIPNKALIVGPYRSAMLQQNERIA
jgi:hypothetical protein